MKVHRVLDTVFRSRSHVAVLRSLLDTTVGFTGNHVARLSGMHPRSALKALTALEELGIVRRQRGGRDHIFTLNREHFLMENALMPVFAAEQKFPEAVRLMLSACLDGHVLSAVIFGSTARNDETAESDLDLCCIVKSKDQEEMVRTTLASEAQALGQQFGVKLAPLIFTLSEFRSKANTGAIQEIIRDGKLITGKKPEVLLYGQANRPQGG